MPENIRVCTRIRPVMGDKEQGVPVVTQALPDGKNVECLYDNKVYNFTSDVVFSQSATQSDVFNLGVVDLLDKVTNGVNAAVVAYGQTGSGKTFTMQGEDQLDEEKCGVTPRVLRALFQRIENADADDVYFVMCSAIQIYKEEIHDMLADGIRCDIMEDRNRGIWVTNATSVPCNSQREVEKLIAKAEENRYTGATKQNEESSRSHQVFLIAVCRRSVSDHTERLAHLYLVDLAGSECVGKTESTGQRLDEAKFINKSLFTLRRVIDALVNNKPHVPYRDSKLTRLLQNSFGGNAKTTLIVCVSPSAYNATETMSSLRFGTSTGKIVNKPVENVHRSAEELETLITETNKDILKAKAQLARLHQDLDLATGAAASRGALLAAAAKIEEQHFGAAGEGSVPGSHAKESAGASGMEAHGSGTWGSEEWPMLERQGSSVIDTDLEEHLPAHFRCPLTKRVMLAPVVAADGVTYDRQAIHKYVSTHDKLPTGKVRTTQIPDNFFIPNTSLQNQIAAYNQALRRDVALSPRSGLIHSSNARTDPAIPEPQA